MELDVENYCVCKQKYMNEDKEEMKKEIKALKDKINELEEWKEQKKKS